MSNETIFDSMRRVDPEAKASAEFSHQLLDEAAVEYRVSSQKERLATLTESWITACHLTSMHSPRLGYWERKAAKRRLHLERFLKKDIKDSSWNVGGILGT